MDYTATAKEREFIRHLDRLIRQAKINNYYKLKGRELRRKRKLKQKLYDQNRQNEE